MDKALWTVGALAAIVALAFYWRKRQQLRGSSVATKIWNFFGTDPAHLPIVNRKFTRFDLPNIQSAIQTYVAQNQATREVIGYAKEFGPFGSALGEIIVNSNAYSMTMLAPVSYRQVEVGPGELLDCVENGIHLITANNPIVCHVRQDMMSGAMQVEVLAETTEVARSFFDQLDSILARDNVYQGKILTIEGQVMDHMRGECAAIRFHAPRRVAREDIILPEDTLDLIERNTIDFFKKASVLKAAGRSAKRGVLLHGKPGTGKTFTAKWLATSMPGLTTIILSAEQLYLIKECCTLARMLAPSMVIMEDIDLVATHRDETTKHVSAQVTLHQILNELDGMSDNTEVLFLMTTNRPQAIEPALAGRPGRIDQAIEYPLPDSECRRRLIARYASGIDTRLENVDALVERLEGASPAFIQELLRKSLLAASDRDGELVLTDEDVETALRELLFGGGDLTRQLLGFTVAK